MTHPDAGACRCTPSRLCDFHAARGESPDRAPLNAERRWAEAQEFH